MLAEARDWSTPSGGLLYNYRWRRSGPADILMFRTSYGALPIDRTTKHHMKVDSAIAETNLSFGACIVNEAYARSGLRFAGASVPGMSRGYILSGAPSHQPALRIVGLHQGRFPVLARFVMECTFLHLTVAASKRPCEQV